MMILEELQLDAFLYEVEPRDDIWEITIECACHVDGGWERIVLQIPKAMLLDSFDNDEARQRLFEYWKKSWLTASYDKANKRWWRNYYLTKSGTPFTDSLLNGFTARVSSNQMYSSNWRGNEA